jgi:hypothetical protein
MKKLPATVWILKLVRGSTRPSTVDGRMDFTTIRTFPCPSLFLSQLSDMLRVVVLSSTLPKI